MEAPKPVTGRGGPIPYHTCPNPGLAEGFRRYFEQGVMPGSFLQAVLANDLYKAVTRADAVNIGRLRDIMIWVQDHAPENSWFGWDIIAAYAEQRREVWKPYQEHVREITGLTRGGQP